MHQDSWVLTHLPATLCFPMIIFVNGGGGINFYNFVPDKYIHTFCETFQNLEKT